MKTSQLSKDTSADRRSKLGVCTPPYHSTTRPSTPLSLSALWGLWTGRIKSDWEQFGLIPLPTQMLFLKCFKEKEKKNLIDTIGSDWASLLIFFFFFFLAARFKVRKKKREAAWKKKEESTTESWSTKQLFFFDKTSVAKGQGDLHGEASKEKDTGWKMKGHEKYSSLSFTSF